MPTSPARIALVALLALVGAACGDDGPDRGEPQSQVAPDVTTFVGRSLDDVPVPPGAEPLGPLDEVDDGVLVRSYEVRDQTPAGVLAFYEDLLADRPVVSPVRDAPGAAPVLRGEWQLEGGVLRVTAQEAPTLDDGGPVTQLSLQLGRQDP